MAAVPMAASSAVAQQTTPPATPPASKPKGKPAALDYVSAFIEEAKASGLVRRALDEMGLNSSIVAPAGMKG